MTKSIEAIGFYMRLTPTDKMIIDNLSEEMGMSDSDIVRMSLYYFAENGKKDLVSDATRELAKAKKVDLKMSVLKELETINHRHAFYLDGFRTLINIYKEKYAPLSIVRKYVCIKLLSLYVLYADKERTHFLKYLRQHYLHSFPQERKWIDSQISFIRHARKQDKEKLLIKIQKQLKNAEDKRNMLEVQADERSVVKLK